ncbi:DNA polymerase III subunit delta' [Vogesella indigofera]|uniref:DNA polymerase III subunit delta' n=1 Tax=Vogesella indigofera TaxID=45465 RepID=UPI00234F5DBD|nr:DNA polymerase III subunit delta' [Vogesella indigofera]MDC7699170.1 DNA polymerase III subunit delta' [Vogesella indigofera]
MRYPWQASDWQRLAANFERLPNAWLLSGPAGIGKREFAQEVARSLLCEAPQADHHACGQCQACHWFAAGNHPDLRVLTPHGDDEEAEDGKEAKAPKRKLPVIKIDGVRNVIEFAHLSAHRGGRRVVIVEPAEALNPAAANALLKVLEEPPAEVVFLLVSDAPQRLLPTIKSRCRQFPLSLPSPSQALAWVNEQGVADAAAELAFHGGMPLFEHDAAEAALRKQFVSGLTECSMGSVLSLADAVDKQKVALELPLRWLGKWLHDLAALRLGGAVRYFPAQQAAMQRLLPRLNIHVLMDCQRELTALAPYGQHTLVTRLQLEALLMNYLKAFAGKPT